MSRSLLTRARAARVEDPLAGTIVVARMDVAAQNHAAAEGYGDPYPTPQAMRRDDSRRRPPTDEPGATRARDLPTAPGGVRHTRGETAGRNGEHMPYDAPLSVIRESANRQEMEGSL